MINQDVVSQVAIGLILAVYGNTSYKLKKLDEKLNKDEVIELIDLKQESLKAIQMEIKEDCTEIKIKLSKLEDYLRS